MSREKVISDKELNELLRKLEAMKYVFSEEDFQKVISEYKLDYKLVKFDGDHRIFPDVLKNISDNF